MKIFCVLTIFISLLIAALGGYLIADTALHWQQSYFSVARIVVGAILALLGITFSLAVLAIIASDKVKKYRMKKKRDRK